jgi:type II secretory pathway pseudopilin PulG
MNFTVHSWRPQNQKHTCRGRFTCRNTVRACLEKAFTRVDGLVMVLLVGFLFAVLLPALANTQARSERLQCLNNLRLIARAFQIWGADHGDYRPWRVAESEGGTSRQNKAGNVWYELSWVSNELVTPTILVCPSDTETRRIALDFSSRAEGGLLHFNYRNNAVSYFLALDTFPELPDVVLAGDRNLQVDGVNGGCSSGINNATVIRKPPSNAGWTNSIHRFSGNLVFDDGHLEETSTAELHKLVPRPGDDNGIDHLLMPR